MGITCGFWRYTMPVIANTHPKGGVGKTTSSVNIVGEMKSDTVDLDTHTGLSIILGLRPEGKEISV
ncbi:ParA family protein, partial [Klebsiella pneumoniae]|nr:ParA family protein [Klebsiella pneumoniae]